GGVTCSGKALVSQCAPEAPIGVTFRQKALRYQRTAQSVLNRGVGRPALNYACAGTRFYDSCQASTEHLEECAEFPLLRNRRLGPLAVTVLPITLARRAAATVCAAV